MSNVCSFVALRPFGGWTATTRLVNPGLADDNGTVGERWPGRSMAERQVQARARVARWERPVQLRVALPAGPGADQLFARLEADWDAIGIKVLVLGLGAVGLANMWAAIFADVGVMVLAVLNAMRALFIRTA